MYTEKQFEIAIEKAAKACGLDAHISFLNKKSEMVTWADRVIGIFFRKGMAVKRSYMMCDTLDMTFFFTKNGRAIYTYAGYADMRDASDKRIVTAFRKANEMRNEMEKALAEMNKKENINE